MQKQLGDKQQLLEQQLADLAQEKSAAELRHSQAPSSEKQGRSQPTRRVTVRMTGAGPVSGLLISYVVPAARFFLPIRCGFSTEASVQVGRLMRTLRRSAAKTGMACGCRYRRRI